MSLATLISCARNLLPMVVIVKSSNTFVVQGVRAEFAAPSRKLRILPKLPRVSCIGRAGDGIYILKIQTKPARYFALIFTPDGAALFSPSGQQFDNLDFECAFNFAKIEGWTPKTARFWRVVVTTAGHVRCREVIFVITRPRYCEPEFSNAPHQSPPGMTQILNAVYALTVPGAPDWIERRLGQPNE